MFKNLINWGLSKFGFANLGLRIAETILRGYTFKQPIPYSGWTNEVLAKLNKMADDKQFDNDETAEFVKYIRTVTPKNFYLNISLRVSETIFKNVEYSTNIPYSGWTDDIIDQFEKISEDGVINNKEAANFVKFIRENRQTPYIKSRRKVNILEFYEGYNEIINTVATLLGGGFVIQTIHWVKSRWQKEATIDQSLEALQETSGKLTEYIEEQRNRLDELKELSQQTASQQKAIQVKIQQLQEYKEDTQKNTKAIIELGQQIETLIDSIEKNGS